MAAVAFHWQVKGAPFSEYPDLYDRDAQQLHPYFYYTPKHSLAFTTRDISTYVVFPYVILTKASQIQNLQLTQTVYLQGDLENLQKLEDGLAVFCKRSNAMINWHKSCAIWLSHETHPEWHPHPAFKWINQGASTKYLGFQIGFNIPPQTMIAPVIHPFDKS